MDFSKNSSIADFTILILLFTGVLYICIWSPILSHPIFTDQTTTPDSPNSNLSTIEFPIDELELALRRASMPNKTVIIAVVNKAYVDQSVKAETTMLDLFLESFWLGENTRGLLDHLLLVAVDQTAYDRCKFKRLHCYRLITDGVDFGGEKVYMSDDFIKMMWRRTLLLLDVLNHGYNFIFTDTDVMWLRNPFERLSNNATIDFQVSVDVRKANSINTGFYYITSNNKTSKLFETWYNLKDNSTGMKEQDVLNMLIHTGNHTQLGINIKYLNTLYFSGFCEDSEDIKSVVTVHANCCRHIDAKVNDLKNVLRDWKTFKAANVVPVNNETIIKDENVNGFSWSPHSGCMSSW